MRKLSILAIMLLVAVTASAGFRWGATLGVGQNSMKFKQELVTVDRAVGGQAGILGEVIFPGLGLGVDLGLRYNMMGAKVDLGEKLVWSSLGYGRENVMIHNINIPIHARFKWTRLNGIEDKVAPFVFAGPEINFQVGHTNASAFKCSGGDVGIAVGGGAEIFHDWQVSFSYTWGMTYIAKTRLLDNFSARSRQWSVSVVRFF